MSGIAVASGRAATTRVAIDELFSEVAGLAALARVASDWSDRARLIRRALVAMQLEAEPGAWNGAAPAESLTRATHFLDETGHWADRLRASLQAAAQQYGATEAMVAALWDAGSRLGGWMVGAATPLALAPAAIVGVGAAGALIALGAWLRSAVDPDGTEADLRRLLSSPVLIDLVRAAGGSLDEVVLGSAGLPAPVALALGERHARERRAAAGADRLPCGDRQSGARRDAGRGARVGSTRRRRVPVAADPASDGRRRTRPSNPVPRGRGSADRHRTVRHGERPPVRRLPRGHGRHVARARHPALDVTNDVTAVAEASAASGLARVGPDASAMSRAVREALDQAGVRPTDPVLAVGYSAGGIAAADLLADDRWNVERAVNLGGPVAQVDPGGKPLLSLEHRDDVIPALGGAGRDHPEGADAGRIVVERTSLAGEEASGTLPAHDLARYRETAALVDGSDTARLVEFADAVQDFTGAAPGRRSTWVAERVSPGSGG